MSDSHYLEILSHYFEILTLYFVKGSHYNDLQDVFFFHHIGGNGLPYKKKSSGRGNKEEHAK